MRERPMTISGEAPARHGLSGDYRRQSQDAARAMCS